ncbi:unnamed protein product [Nyctereutes procyonoides]|uniref:(raccoon dog) hypothetical protein n=1 Tax=Nyctereutes procyonoides TaxID=34880 RepID=A0A811YR22_NYCPR|nr:unnamed protein product [Nyctereutes procyonoides]
MVGCTPRRGANASETRLPTSPVQREDTHRSHLRSLERSPKGPGTTHFGQAWAPEKYTQSSARAQGHELNNSRLVSAFCLPGCACPRPCLRPCLCAVSGPPTSADGRLSCLQVAAQTHRDAKGKAWWESWRGLRRQPRVSQPFLCDGKTQRGGKSTKLHSEREKSTEEAATLQETRTKGFGLDHPRRTPGTLWNDFSGRCAPAGG